MAYEIKMVGDDACTIADEYGEQMMRIITIETEPGVFVQKPVMRRNMARRIVSALRLCDALASSVLAEQNRYPAA